MQLKLRTYLLAVFTLLLLAPATRPAHALQFGAPAIVSATEIPQSALLQPAQLNAMIEHPGHGAPLMLQVGSRLMFEQGHIPGSEFAGPAVQPEGIALLRNRVASLPKGKLIIIYCGCCPWTRCPNMGTAYRFLTGLGFTNVKALYLPSNFGADWVSKGYRVER